MCACVSAPFSLTVMWTSYCITNYIEWKDWHDTVCYS